MKKLVYLFLMLFTGSTIIGQTYEGDKNDINIILDNGILFSKYVTSSNYEMIGNCYTQDAKIFPQKGKIIIGRPDIINYWTLPKGVKTSYHKITPSEVKIVDDTAYDYGYYEGSTIKTNGKTSNWKGKYVIVWKKQGNEWKIYLDIWNNI